MDILQFVLLLSEIPGIGERRLGRILERNAVLRRSPEEFLKLSAGAWRKEYNLEDRSVFCLQNEIPLRQRRASEQAHRLQRAGVTLVTLQDATYPASLLNYMEDPPPVLYVYGSISLLGQRRFAVANSRDAPEESLRACERVAEAAVLRGWMPVTGHNRLAYQRCALSALRNGGSVCYALDCGIWQAFPSGLTHALFPAARIWRVEYDPQRDLTLTPFPPHAHMIAHHNRRRDEIIFALAETVFAGYVRPGGQMERQCLQALRYGKPVYVIGSSAEGEDRLLSAGAQPLSVHSPEQTERALRICEQRIADVTGEAG
jgi:predicted Rossmann fold nucleotide-binding protein DprA/Smf involved in DNA uptake